MFNIEDILSENFSGYPQDAQEFMKKFNEKLRDNIKNELINDVAEKMLKDIEKSRNNFMDMLTNMLEMGCEGFNEMSSRALLNMYLEGRKEEDFMMLLEKTAGKIE